MVINMLYIGSGSCVQFYEIGQDGLIEPHMCDPIQFFAYEPCGCGEFNTNIQQAPPPGRSIPTATESSPSPRANDLPTSLLPTLMPSQGPTIIQDSDDTNGKEKKIKKKKRKKPDKENKDNLKLSNQGKKGGQGGVGGKH